jgi:protein O-GlcNAc transferase
VPEHHQGQFTETIWYLPDTRLCFTPPADSMRIPPTSLPGMRNGYITFGSFQKLGKINERVIALWGRVFRAVPDARLRLQNRQMNCPAAREHLLDQLANSGIAPERVAIAGEVPREGYLAAHAEVDIILDTFPFPGGTTTCESLWMGVPTLTLAGDTLLGRQGASLLACAGLNDWIASDEDEYVVKAISHATDVDRLAQLRIGLRDQVKDSPLFDGRRFAHNLENALCEMWQKRKRREFERQ